jgi:hypothetical protein
MSETLTLLPYHHRKGVHCISTGMMNLLRNHGLDLSEDMCMGIGSGLGFTYLRSTTMAKFLVFGRSDDLEWNLARALGAHIRMDQEHDSDAAFAAVLRELKAGSPVLLDTDVSRLSYAREALAWPEAASHGGHKLVVIGYDEATRMVHVADYAWSKPQVISLDELYYAWKGATEGPVIQAQNFYFRFVFPKVFTPLDVAIKNGLRLNVFRFLNSWNKFYGIKALRGFLNDVTAWKVFLNEEARKENAYSAYISLEIGGTGKGAFRRMYARFLREAAEILDDARFETLSKDYFALSRQWTELALLLLAGSEDANGGIFSGDPAHEKLTQEILQAEKAAIGKIQEITLEWR